MQPVSLFDLSEGELLMLVVNNPVVLREQISQWRREGRAIAFVPTMGCPWWARMRWLALHGAIG